MRAANAAAAVVVGKRGTATLSAAELRSRILPAASLAAEEKIVFDWSVLDERLADGGGAGLRIGFTNGCFDLLHPGHVKLLAQARAACDRLVVGLNGDASVRRLKGDEPPDAGRARARRGAGGARSGRSRRRVRRGHAARADRARAPAVLVKGGDYRREEVVGHDLVEAEGGEVMLVDLVPGHSTTALVQRSAAQPAEAAARLPASRLEAGARRKPKSKVERRTAPMQDAPSAQG